MPEPQYFNVRADHEWGEFFVLDRGAIPERDGGVRYAATWVANTSYGVYGHYWSHMGCPFPEFAAQVSKDPHYLLGKISKKVPDAKLAGENLKREILQARRDRYCTSEQAREAIEAVDRLADEYGERDVFSRWYEDEDIGKVMRNRDWDFPTTSHPLDAVNFVRKLWPEFVKAINVKEPETDVHN